MNMTRNILNHFTYGMDSMDYRHSTRFGPPMHDRGFGPSRPNPRTDPMARQHPHQHQSRGGSASHPATVQSNNASGPPRRRIGVACGRCRKRKIRCSGDPGDNTGCQNCKNAQLQQGACVFLRVSSSNIDLSPSYSSSSPAISSASTACHGLGLGLPHASLSTPTLHSTLGSQPLRLGGHGLGIGNGLIDSKPLYHSDTLGSSMCDPASSMPLAPRSFYDMGNDMSGPGDSNYPQYILSNSHSGHGIPETSGVGVLQHSEFPRHWTTIQTTGKTSGGSSGYFLEPEATSGINTISQIMSTAPSYVPASSNRILNGGISSSTNSSLDSYPTIFPALTSLSSSLPEGGSRPSMSLSDKVLPPLPTRIQSSDFGSGNIKGTLYSSYTDSSALSSNSHSRSSTSSHRSPTVNYVTSSPSMQIPSSQRSTPTLVPPNSALTGSAGNYVTSSATSSGSYNNGMLYPSNQPTLMGSAVDQMPVHSMPAQKQQQRTDSELSLQQYQITPRSSAHAPAPPLRTSSSSNASSNYQQTSDQNRISMGLNKVY